MMNISGRIVAGVFLILLGVLFLMQQLGIIQLDIIAKLWPLAIIVVGVVLVFGWSKNR
jgi:energy-converting hydrogenase Eha subunit E